jgi:hypothetical protein
MTTNDRLTREVTAFRSWAEMVQAMESGYVPTLAESSAAEDREWNKSVGQLASAVEAAGFRCHR